MQMTSDYINKIFNCDCLEGLKDIPDNSVDCIITDPPYGTTDCTWDKTVDLNLMWEQFLRVTKENAAIVIFSQMPFGAELVLSNKKIYRYEWIWQKNCAVGFMNAKKMPLRCHENILVFYRKLPTYNPQFTQGKPYLRKNYAFSLIYSNQKSVTTNNADGKRYPVDILKFNIPKKRTEKQPHPTQKPVALIEYLIKTYTNEGEIVLDPFIGSGTTAVACIKSDRNFVGYELDEKYFEICQKRIDETLAEKQQELFTLKDF